METIEQAAERYAWLKKIGNDFWGEERKWAKNGFVAGVEFAQQWISVKKELPEKEGMYLVKVSKKYSEAGYDIRYYYPVDYAEKVFLYRGVTHWRQIELK